MPTTRSEKRKGGSKPIDPPATSKASTPLNTVVIHDDTPDETDANNLNDVHAQYRERCLYDRNWRERTGHELLKCRADMPVVDLLEKPVLLTPSPSEREILVAHGLINMEDVPNLKHIPKLRTIEGAIQAISIDYGLRDDPLFHVSGIGIHTVCTSAAVTMMKEVCVLSLSHQCDVCMKTKAQGMVVIHSTSPLPPLPLPRLHHPISRHIFAPILFYPFAQPIRPKIYYPHCSLSLLFLCYCVREFKKKAEGKFKSKITCQLGTFMLC